ncbi:MFS transporter [Bacillus sp. ISL-75]|uniref:MFS transporter n=1 Tax=Bacillus sp. ISL-75 TaxID=2819137 RepID=UPI001BE5D437|nr:MFS transporter [Bacillus sp. ISL-75]MBT2728141.1 MFS transporter [Bacillus sp. ISL-75]
MGNTWKIYMLAFIGFFVGTNEFVIAGILNKVADSAHISVSAAGQLITVFSIAYAFGPTLVIMALSKMDKRKLLMISLAILVLGSIMTAALPSFIFLIVSRVVLAVGTGIFVITAMDVAPKLASPNRQGSAIATVFAGFSTSLIIGIPIGRIVAQAYDWRVIFWGIALLSLLAIFAIARWIPTTEAAKPIPFRMQMGLLKRPVIALTIGVTLFGFISYSVFNTFMTPFLSSVLHMGEGEISIIFFALGVASLVGSKLGGFLADRIGIDRTLFGSLSVQFLVLTVLSIVLMAFAHSVIISIVLIMIWSIAVWTFSTTQNFKIVTIGQEASGILLSLNMTIIQIGIAAGAGIGGVATGSTMQPITWVGAVSALIALIISVGSLGFSNTSRKSVEVKL